MPLSLTLFKRALFSHDFRSFDYIYFTINHQLFKTYFFVRCCLATFNMKYVDMMMVKKNIVQREPEYVFQNFLLRRIFSIKINILLNVTIQSEEAMQ